MNVTETIQKIFSEDIDRIDSILRVQGWYSHKNSEGRGEILSAAIDQLVAKIGTIPKLRAGGMEITLPEKEFESLERKLDEMVSRVNGGAKAILIHLAIRDLYSSLIARSLILDGRTLAKPQDQGKEVRNQDDIDREKLIFLRMEVKV